MNGYNPSRCSQLETSLILLSCDGGLVVYFHSFCFAGDVADMQYSLSEKGFLEETQSSSGRNTVCLGVLPIQERLKKKKIKDLTI